MSKNKMNTTDLTADDFGKIRNMVRVSLLHRGLDTEIVNQLMSAYRTMQPIFSAATKLYKGEGKKEVATEAVDKAVAYLKGDYSNETPF